MRSAPITLAWFVVHGSAEAAPTMLDPRAILADIENQTGVVVSQIEVRNEFDSVNQMLDIPLGSVLAAAWSRGKEIFECLNSSRGSPNDDFYVSLADHEIKSIHRPKLNVIFEKALVASETFEIELSLHLTAVKLRVRNGEVDEALSGSCSGSAELRWRDIVLVKGATRDFDLPGRIQFSEDKLPRQAEKMIE